MINRSANRLYLYDSAKLRRTFAVATGQAIYPTPRGTFHIVVKWKNPWWYPPTQDSWAKGLKPVPPGPDNPLGTRWMGLSVPGRRDSRHGRALLDRLQPLARVHPHAGAGRRMALRPRRDRDDGPHRLMGVVRVAAVTVVLGAARAARLGRRPPEEQGDRDQGRPRRDGRRTRSAFAASRRRSRLRPRGLSRQGRRRQLLGFVVRRVQARGEDAPRRRRALARARRS